MSLPIKALEGLTPEQKADVLKTFAENSGMGSIGWPHAFVLVGIAFSMAIGFWAHCKYN